MLDKAIDTLDVGMRVYMRVISRVAPHKIGKTFFGCKMYCDTRDFIQRRIFYFHIYEPNLTHYMLTMVKPGDHVLDVGSNVGYFTLLLSSIVGDSGKVVAIEASPSTYQQLTRNLALNDCGNVVPLNVAATGGPCMVDIVDGEKNNSGSNSIRHSSGDGTVSVKGDALSNMHEIAHDKITFIKIDVEGSEAPVIQDIIDTIDRYPNLRGMAMELVPESGKFFEMLQARGFRGYAFPNNYRIGYLLVRNYLRQSEEQGFVVKLPVSQYDPAYRDYVFERGETTSP
jgi:FkbM family methyltransferase